MHRRLINSQEGVVIGGTLKVRAGPSKSNTQIGTLRDGTKITIIGSSGDFYQIQYSKSPAYVMKSYVRVGGSSSSSPSSPSQTSPTKPQTGQISGSYSTRTREYVYQQPAEKGEYIIRLEKGTNIKVVRQSGNFYEIQLSGRTGFVKAASVVNSAGKYYGPNSGVAGRIVSTAQSKLGCPYVYQSVGPSAFDCAGLVAYCHQVNGILMPTGTQHQEPHGTAIAISAMQPGDAVYFDNNGNGKSDHVGIYTGPDSMIHAPHTGDVVKYGNLKGRNILCARRFW